MIIRAVPYVTTDLREAENVSDEILKAAEEAGSDLIMVGCTDKGVIKRLLLGSISQRMARYSKTRSGQYGKNAVVPDILRLLEPLNKINTNNSMC